MARTMGIHETQVDIGSQEWQIIVPTIPDQHISFRFGDTQNSLIVDPSIDDRALLHVRGVFLAFFNGTVVLLQIVKRRKALHALGGEVAVGHRVAHDHGVETMLAQECDHTAGHRTFATASPHRTHGDHRHLAGQHRRVDPEA